MPYFWPVSISCVYTCKANWKDIKSDGTSADVEILATEAKKTQTKQNRKQHISIHSHCISLMRLSQGLATPLSQECGRSSPTYMTQQSSQLTHFHSKDKGSSKTLATKAMSLTRYSSSCTHYRYTELCELVKRSVWLYKIILIQILFLFPSNSNQKCDVSNMYKSIPFMLVPPFLSWNKKIVHKGITKFTLYCCQYVQ